MPSAKEWIRRRKRELPPEKKAKTENPLTVRALLSALYTSGLRLTIGLILLAIFGIAIAFLVGRIDPKTQILLAGFRGPFDEKATDSSALASEASDMFSDSLNQIIETGQSYSGTRGSSRKSQQTQQPFDPVPQIPISHTFGIEFKGISIDNIFAIWNQIRYNQETVTGDVVPVEGENRRYVLHLTWRMGDSIYHWIGAPYLATDSDMESALMNAALQFVNETNPEIAGRYLLSRGNFDGAMATFTDWMQRNPQQPEPYWYIAKAFDWQGEYLRALPFADRAQELLSNARENRRRSLQTGIYLTESLQYFMVTDPDVAQFQKFVDAHLARDPNALTNLGLRYLQRGKLREAEKVLTAALKLDPGDFVTDTILGETFEAERKFSGAVEAFEAEVRLDPSSISAATKLVRSLDEAGDFHRASQFCNSWVYPGGSAGVLIKATEADLYFWCESAEEKVQTPPAGQLDSQRWYAAEALSAKSAPTDMDTAWSTPVALVTLHNLLCVPPADNWTPNYRADLLRGIDALNQQLAKRAANKDIQVAISDCRKFAEALHPAGTK